jgi:mono/diheme cytochrome c family protein
MTQRWTRDLFGGIGLAAVVVSFLALIWMDSALFYIIQQNPDYKSATWSSVRLWVNGPVHALFAVLAGLAIDRGWFRPLPGLAYLLLCGGSLVLMAGSEALGLASPLYVGGVSIYSVALIAYPSLWAETQDLVSRAWRAALLFGIGGWVGSGLGIGMARDLAHIPLSFLLAAGLVMAVTALIAERLSRPKRLDGTVLMLCLIVSGCAPVAGSGTPAELGRMVYIQEGCINCHSQYVRPGTADVEMWGPVREKETQQPPLYGNRRLGPDLTNVANRRSLEWQELHLRDPRAVTRHSAMPGYGYLFKDERGKNLLAYLGTLGSDTLAARLMALQNWHPDGAAEPCSSARAATLFGDLCAGCHRTTALAGGAAASQLSLPVRDLELEPLRYANAPGADPDALARTIKFGLPGTSMPGHEYLGDSEVLGLVAYVRELGRQQRQVL